MSKFFQIALACVAYFIAFGYAAANSCSVSGYLPVGHHAEYHLQPHVFGNVLTISVTNVIDCSNNSPCHHYDSRISLYDPLNTRITPFNESRLFDPNTTTTTFNFATSFPQSYRIVYATENKWKYYGNYILSFQIDGICQNATLFHITDVPTPPLYCNSVRNPSFDGQDLYQDFPLDFCMGSGQNGDFTGIQFSCGQNGVVYGMKYQSNSWTAAACLGTPNYTAPVGSNLAGHQQLCNSSMPCNFYALRISEDKNSSCAGVNSITLLNNRNFRDEVRLSEYPYTPAMSVLIGDEHDVCHLVDSDGPVYAQETCANGGYSVTAGLPSFGSGCSDNSFVHIDTNCHTYDINLDCDEISHNSLKTAIAIELLHGCGNYNPGSTCSKNNAPPPSNNSSGLYCPSVRNPYYQQTFSFEESLSQNATRWGNTNGLFPLNVCINGQSSNQAQYGSSMYVCVNNEVYAHEWTGTDSSALNCQGTPSNVAKLDTSVPGYQYECQDTGTPCKYLHVRLLGVLGETCGTEYYGISDLNASNYNVFLIEEILMNESPYYDHSGIVFHGQSLDTCHTFDGFEDDGYGHEVCKNGVFSLALGYNDSACTVQSPMFLRFDTSCNFGEHWDCDELVWNGGGGGNNGSMTISYYMKLLNGCGSFNSDTPYCTKDEEPLYCASVRNPHYTAHGHFDSLGKDYPLDVCLSKQNVSSGFSGSIKFGCSASGQVYVEEWNSTIDCIGASNDVVYITYDDALCNLNSSLPPCNYVHGRMAEDINAGSCANVNSQSIDLYTFEESISMARTLNGEPRSLFESSLLGSCHTTEDGYVSLTEECHSGAYHVKAYMGDSSCSSTPFAQIDTTCDSENGTTDCVNVFGNLFAFKLLHGCNYPGVDVVCPKQPQITCPHVAYPQLHQNNSRHAYDMFGLNRNYTAFVPFSSQSPLFPIDVCYSLGHDLNTNYSGVISSRFTCKNGQVYLQEFYEYNPSGIPLECNGVAQNEFALDVNAPGYEFVCPSSTSRPCDYAHLRVSIGSNMTSCAHHYNNYTTEAQFYVDVVSFTGFPHPSINLATKMFGMSYAQNGVCHSENHATYLEACKNSNYKLGVYYPNNDCTGSPFFGLDTSCNSVPYDCELNAFGQSGYSFLVSLLHGCDEVDANIGNCTDGSSGSQLYCPSIRNYHFDDSLSVFSAIFTNQNDSLHFEISNNHQYGEIYPLNVCSGAHNSNNNLYGGRMLTCDSNGNAMLNEYIGFGLSAAADCNTGIANSIPVMVSDPSNDLLCSSSIQCEYYQLRFSDNVAINCSMVNANSIDTLNFYDVIGMAETPGGQLQDVWSNSPVGQCNEADRNLYYQTHCADGVVRTGYGYMDDKCSGNPLIYIDTSCDTTHYSTDCDYDAIAGRYAYKLLSGCGTLGPNSPTCPNNGGNNNNGTGGTNNTRSCGAKYSGMMIVGDRLYSGEYLASKDCNYFIVFSAIASPLGYYYEVVKYDANGNSLATLLSDSLQGTNLFFTITEDGSYVVSDDNGNWIPRFYTKPGKYLLALHGSSVSGFHEVCTPFTCMYAI